LEEVATVICDFRSSPQTLRSRGGVELKSLGKPAEPWAVKVKVLVFVF
jgi:hypothetical protein